MDLKGGGKETTAHSWFAYTGPSSNEVPPSVNPADELDDVPAAAATGAGAAAGGAVVPAAGAGAVAAAGGANSKRKDLSGIWNRTKSVNFEAVIGATGAGFMQRKIAASMALTHTITMDKAFTAVRLQEKGGPINIDFTLTVGATEAAPYDNNGKKLTHKVYWDEDALVMHRVVLEGNYELVNKRVLDESTDVKQLVCSIMYRDLRSGNEVEATSWFTYLGPSTMPLPVPDLSKLPKAVEAPSPAAAAEAAAAKKAEAAKAELDLDDEEDDDDVAVAKMRMSVAVASPAAARLAGGGVGGGAYRPGGGAVGGMGTGGGGGHSHAVGGMSTSPYGSSSAVGGSMQPYGDSARRPVFTGTWQRDVGQGVSAKFQLTHTIRLEGNSFVLKEQDSQGKILEELMLTVGADYILKKYPPRKQLQCRCYWEGATIVVQQINTQESYELFVRRNVEENGQQIRLTTTQRSLTTGEESESMSIFTLIAKKM